MPSPGVFIAVGTELPHHTKDLTVRFARRRGGGPSPSVRGGTGVSPAEAGVGHTQQTQGNLMKKRTVSKWTTALALTVGGAMLATSAVAQSGTAPAKSSADTTKSDAPKADATKSATTGSTAGDTKSGAMKSDTMKSDTMKSGEKKSGAMKSGAARDSAQGTDREQVKAVQQALKDKGHDPGEVDGAMGPKTQAALRDFQQKEGLKATGAADADTMAKLTVSANTPAASPSGTAPSATGAPKDATSPGAKQTK